MDIVNARLDRRAFFASSVAAHSAPDSPESAESGRTGGKTLSLRPRAGLAAPRPCQGIRGIRATPEVIAPA